MIEKLKDFYNRELEFIREEGREFSNRFPKIAGRLRLSGDDTVEDPHVSRLIESFALLCARLRLKIEDNFPELCQSMLQALYPQYIAPVPPASICQMRLTDLSNEHVEGQLLKRGCRIETEEVDGEPCIFRTCFDTTLYPIKVSQAEFVHPPLPFATEPSWTNQTQAAIRLRLESVSPKLHLSDLALNNLRFYLDGSAICGNELLAALLDDAVGVALFADHKSEGKYLPGHVITPVGFHPDEAILNHDARTQSAYRILWEYFALPHKFRFVDIQFGRRWAEAAATKKLDLVIYLRRSNPNLMREFGIDSMRLGCTPVVNLFHHYCEPICFTENQYEYRVIPSARRPLGLEIHSIDEVVASSPGGQEQRTYVPFHLPPHNLMTQQFDRYWHASRRQRLAENANGDRGTEIFLSIVDLQSRPKPSDEWTLHVTATCSNRDRVARLPFGLNRPNLVVDDGRGAIAANLLIPPTPTRRAVTEGDYYWRLISHLSLNHLLLADNDKGAEALREVLSLYDLSELEENQRAIASVRSVRNRRSSARLPGENGSGICRGLDIEIEVDEERLVGVGTYLFSSILDQFFSMFCTINSFTRLTVHTITHKRPLYRGKPRAGGKQFL